MTSHPRLALGLAALPLAGLLAATVSAQSDAPSDQVAATRQAMSEAQRQGAAARARAERLELQAAQVTQAAEKTAREEAAVAARIQETEAKIAENEDRVRQIAEERRQLHERLARRQQPLVRLTAALQRLSRRPPVLALLRPGSVREAMYMRALLATMLPEVERLTAALRADIEKGRALEGRALAAARALHASEAEFKQRRETLVALETRQRLASRKASGIAAREADRALALAEKAKDLGGLVDDLEREGELRAQLALLPGPLMRPAQPSDAKVVPEESPSPSEAALQGYSLPVTGRVVTGFGERRDGQPRSHGITLATHGGAQAVAPAPGRVVFAGPYRGYGNIVIIEHDGGWTSLVTGLVQLDTHVGEELVQGSPLGIAGPGEPVVTLELRHDGEPVNPLQYVTAS